MMWMKKKLKEVCTFYSGTGFPTQYQGETEGDYPFYKVGDIANNATAGKVYLELCNNYIDDNVAKTIKGCILPKDTVVFAKIGEALKLNRRAITGCDCLIDNNAMGIAPKREALRIQYFYFLMKNLKMQTLAESTTVPSVRKTVLEDYEIEVPSIDEQEEIEKKLVLTQEIIEMRKKELTALDNLIKARFVELFGDMILNPNGWEKVLLGDACDVRDGTHDSPKYFTEGYPLVTSKNVTGGKIDFTDCSLICEEDYNKINQRSKVDLGDILMPMIGTVGNPVIVDVDEEFAIKNVALIKFKENSAVINTFVKALLESDYFDRSVISKVRGGTQKFISLGDIRKLEICLPPIIVQEQFADFVKQVDKSKFKEKVCYIRLRILKRKHHQLLLLKK